MRAAIYCRLSEEDKGKADGADSGSIQNQKMLLTQYADAQGWEIYDIYSDDDYAGADRNRPEFNRLLNDAEAKRFGIVLCKTQSRFTRELELVEKYIHGLFPVWGIRFVSVADNCDTDDPGNKKTRQINGLVNVAPPNLLVVNKVRIRAVTGDNAFDRKLRVRTPGPGDRAVRVIQDHLDTRARRRRAIGRAREDKFAHRGRPAQFGNAPFPEDPPNGIDDIGLTATVRSDNPG